MKPQAGTVQALFYSQKSNPLYSTPVLQITTLGMFTLVQNEKHRYKANLSDGTYYMKAVFSSELSAKFDSGEIQRFFVVKLGNFTVRAKENNNYLYIQSLLECEPMEAEFGKAVNISNGKQSLEPSSGQRGEDVQKENARQSPVIRSINGIAKMVEDGPKKPKACSNEFTDIRKIFPHKKNMTFRGRVVSKSDIRTFSTQRGEGKLFSFEMADWTGQIKCVVFSENVDVFYPLIEAGKVYAIANGTVKLSNKKFSNSTSDFEVHLERHTEVQRVDEEGIPKYCFKFVKISDLPSSSGLVDCIAVVREVYPVSRITLRSTGKENSKRDVIIADQTGSCRLTLWGSRAEEDIEKDTVICVKSAKVGEYNGITLSTVSNTQVMASIDIPESVELLAWYQEEGRHAAIERPRRVPKRSFISEVKDNSLEYATIQASIMYLREDGLYYESCPSETCNKKVMLEDNGNYRCERCNYTYDKCDYRYMVSLHVGDFTGQMWITVFDESGRSIFGLSARDLKEMGEQNPEEVHNLVKGMVSKEFQFKIRNKQENYNGETRLRSSCMELSSIDMVGESRKMLDAIEKVSI